MEDHVYRKARLGDRGSLNVRIGITRQSGQWRGKSFIGGGRSAVRTVLFVGAMVAKKHNPILRAFFDRLVRAGKPKMQALIAVARKLLTMLNAILRDNRPWQTA